MDNSTITLIIVFAIGWFLGSRIQWFLDQITFKEILKDLGVTTKQLTQLIERADAPAVNQNTALGVELEPVEVTLEQHQGVIYAYRKADSQYLGQGTDQATLIQSITNRMTGVRLIIDQQDGADLLQKNNT
jgi:hypothetical protein